MPNAVRDGSVEQRDEWLFQQASVWSDTLRSERPPERFAYHRGTWHYINVPHFLTAEARLEREDRIERNLELNPRAGDGLDTRDLNVVQVIRIARQACGDRDADAASRAIWLSWLFHNVGDLHQPLHSTALFSSRLFRDGDNGGNFVRTEQGGNLHSLWDGFPGSNARYQEARNRALTLRRNARLAAAGEEAAEVLDEREWLRESHYLAVAVAYDPAIIVALRHMEVAGRNRAEALTMTDDYLQAGGAVAELRLVQAGYRLAAVLREIVADDETME